MNLGGFIDTFKDAIARRVVESYRPSENGGTLPRLLQQAPGCAGRRHQGRGPLPESPPGHHRRRGDGHGQDLQCAALRGIGYPAQPGITRRIVLGPTDPP